MRLPRPVANLLTFCGNAFVHPLARILPRTPTLWAFGAPNGSFEGNSKYLYLWLSRRPSPVTPVWVTPNAALAARLRRQGLRAIPRWSVRGLLTAMRAGLYLVNDNSSDVNFSLSNGAKVFNLWHGVGLKNVLHGSQVGFSADLRRRASDPLHKIRNMRRLERPEWVLSTSPEMSGAFFARCFGVAPSKAPALGYPRLDPQIDDGLKEYATSFDDYSLTDGWDSRRSILYAPTLREFGTGFLDAALPDLERLSDALEAQGAILFLKLHPKMAVEKGRLEALPSNIVVLPSALDLYPVLDRFSALITDYSSLFFDFIAFKSAGVVLYTFDFDDYTARERDLAWDYEEATAGVRANNFDELCDAVRDGRVFAPVDPARLASLRTRFWGGDLGEPAASQRISDYLLAQQGLGQ
ncbi:MAG TPA: CDP-glycerol glycerophosphotransferase family protein [Sphingomicrobium sp.]|nr:CDP-glycerol glycerophosphotransferase family protein [Sphingomicrobium sp.]